MRFKRFKKRKKNTSRKRQKHIFISSSTPITASPDPKHRNTSNSLWRKLLVAEKMCAHKVRHGQRRIEHINTQF